MPLYDVRDKESGEIHEELIRFDDREQFFLDNPHFEQVFVGMMSIGDPIRLGKVQPPDSFKELLRDIKKRNGKNEMSTW